MLRRLQGEGSGDLPTGGTDAGLGGNGSGGGAGVGGAGLAVTGSEAFETTVTVCRRPDRRAQTLRRNPNLFDTRKFEYVATS
jgi:hypothetical protein